MNDTDTRSRIRQDVLQLLEDNQENALRPNQIASRLGYDNDRLYRYFREVLDEMIRKQVVRHEKGNRFRYAGEVDGEKPSNEVEGILRIKPQGFGFAKIDEDEEIFVDTHHVNTALDGDQVRLELFAAPSRGDKLREGKVLEVVERNRRQTVGTFKRQGHFAFVAPDDQRITKDIYVPEKAFNGARDGQKVLVSIDLYDDPKAAPEGRVLHVIGDADDPEVRVLALAMSMDIVAEFPEAVAEETKQISPDIPQAEIDRRLDLRDEAIFTIDPADAKDLDDAIHIKRLTNEKWEIGVHIADVSHYVKPDTALDSEAYERGTSVYLVDRTVPMLPPKLSNSICSLNPDEVKLAHSCIMQISSTGEVIDYNIAETVIRTRQRFSYDEAQTLIEGGHPDHALAKDVVMAARTARKLTDKRMREGSIDFDLPEVKVYLDDEGHPVDIRRKERREANRMIEEFMLLANQCVAREIGLRDDPPPFVYRVHDLPDAERIQKLAQYVRAFGYKLKLNKGNVRSDQLNTLLTQVKGSPEEPVIEKAAVRSMAKAVYATKNIGHYGLGFSHYTHFTSPIRRYPDLMVHRLLKHYARDGASRPDKKAIQAQCEHCSEQERNAQQAERESVKLKQVEYAQNHLGDQFDGVVRGVTKFGVFVEINDLLVEGLVHVRDMNDYFKYDEETYTLIGERTGRTYRPGDEVEVVLSGANTEKREIDLLFA